MDDVQDLKQKLSQQFNLKDLEVAKHILSMQVRDQIYMSSTKPPVMAMLTDLTTMDCPNFDTMNKNMWDIPYLYVWILIMQWLALGQA